MHEIGEYVVSQYFLLLDVILLNVETKHQHQLTSAASV